MLWFQTETDERVVELQNMVQTVTHTEAEIQQMYNLLQDLESSMNNAKQRQELVSVQELCIYIQFAKKHFFTISEIHYGGENVTYNLLKHRNKYISLFKHNVTIFSRLVFF